MSARYHVDPDIHTARTLPASFYRDPDAFRAQIERVLARSWHLIEPRAARFLERSATPLTLLPGTLDEPLLHVREGHEEGCLLSNVCTHRGNLLLKEPCRFAADRAATLRCGYHGRRFDARGRATHMPEFAGVAFPEERDHLPRVPTGRFGEMLFAAVQPAMAFDAWLGPLRERLAFVPWAELVAEPARDYEVAAHFALYCDNFLEGFHIPFVHPGLAAALEFGAYRTELLPWGTLQIGVAKEGEPTLDLPASHPDHGQRVAALYAFLFPCTMINVYPWGVSLNIVTPLAVDRTRVTFVSLVRPGAPPREGAGGDLHQVELEDEAVVESVQRGVRSRFYDSGRFSPSQEAGVHHVHRLFSELLGV